MPGGLGRGLKTSVFRPRLRDSVAGSAGFTGITRWSGCVWRGKMPPLIRQWASGSALAELASLESGIAFLATGLAALEAGLASLEAGVRKCSAGAYLSQIVLHKRGG
jgi:hypothetical protein